MEIFLNIVLILVGFVFLIKGADIFVDASSNIAKHFNISEVIIGLTLVAFGTSFPELSVSVTAALNHSNGIAVGNVIGSNIFNICMVLGFIAMIKPMSVEKSLMKKDIVMSVLSVAVLMFVLFDTKFGDGVDILTRGDGLVLLSFFAIFLYYTIYSVLKSRKKEEKHEESEKFSYIKNITLIIVGVVGIILGGNFVVDGSTVVAAALGLSETLIGLTVVSLGTSLPEFVTSFVAMFKGKHGMAVGNVIGSNLFNAFFILGVSTTISPIVMTGPDIFVDTLVLLGVSILVFIFPLIKKNEINRKEGFVLFATYIIYMAYIIMRDLAL